MLKRLKKLLFPPCKNHLWEVKGRTYDGYGGFTVKLKCNKCREVEYKSFKTAKTAHN